jgi:16S rRNA (guanine966-N2)-methyltransferase
MRTIGWRFIFANAKNPVCHVIMRISGGLARGIHLATPKGEAVRPATDSLRQAVFSSLGDRVVGARFLDLFAGSGSYGLEALSRGADGGLWVEKHRRTFELLRRNIAAVCVSMQRDETDLMVRCGGCDRRALGG